MRSIRKTLQALCLVVFLAFYFPAGLALGVETTSLVGDATRVTVATFNVQNLDPKREDRSRVENRSPRNIDDDVANGKFTALANQIVTNLQAPDIIALQEVQDSDGAELTSVVDAVQTANTLIEEIKSAGGPDYVYRDIPPRNGQDGGQPGGNIRLGFLFNPNRVILQRLERFEDNQAFSNSRKPLVGEFTFNNDSLTLINNHFVSKNGGAPSNTQRIDQATLVNDFVVERLQANPREKIIVLGDINDTPNSSTLRTLEGTVLQNLNDSIPSADRYSYVFRGERELIDQILITSNLSSNRQAEIEAIHVNAGMSNLASDHDPVIARFNLLPSGGAIIPLVPRGGEPNALSEILPNSTVNELLEELDRNFSPRSSLGYGNARDRMYTRIDNKDGIVTDIYGGFSVAIAVDSATPREDATRQGINAEHVWPQSRGATGPAKSDLHNLFAARQEINSDRANFPFADIPDDQTTSWYLDDDELSFKPDSRNLDSFSEFLQGTSFEPRENKKGDIARVMFYFRTVYPELADDNFFQRQRQTLCRWQAEDLIDAEEVARSHAIAQTPQGNENPFVLDPTLLERAYCN